MRLARPFLALVGFVTLGFGLAYLIAPAPLMEQTGYGTLAPEALTDIRATFGGLQMGFGAFLFWTMREQSRYRTGVMSVAIAVPCIAASRAIGLLVDGEPTIILIGALIGEIAISAGAWFVLSKLEPTRP